MLDRASSFAEPEVVRMLSSRYVPVALDEWYAVRRQDAAGELYRQIVYQREGMGPGRTTQGLYLAEPGGALVAGWNNRDPGKLGRRLREHLAHELEPGSREVDATEADPRLHRAPPEGGLVLDVFSKVLEAAWPEPANRWQAVFQGAIGRDHLWITKAEREELARARWPETLTMRIARFHLVDNTRGEPPMWRPGEVRSARIELSRVGETTWRVTGDAELATEDGKRAYRPALAGELVVRRGAVARLDLVARGTFRGHGRYTGNAAPPGPFELGIAFTLAGEEAAAAVPPQGARDLPGYLGR